MSSGEPDACTESGEVSAIAPSLHDPFALGETLARDMGALGHAVRRRSARFDPRVVAYLFRAGWQPVHALVTDPGSLVSLWRLQLESVSAGGFSVADARWREDGEYPDRYFPVLWT